MDSRIRCAWSGTGLYEIYHDEEWGVPSYDDRHLYEMIVLEGAQSGLSWSTILNKREGYRRLFANFDAQVVASFGDVELERFLTDPSIVRNRLKVVSAFENARAVLKVKEEFGSLANFLWRFVDGKPIQNEFKSLSDLPAQTDISKAMSKDMLRRGFRFVGPTVCYAFMQAVGMVNDHTTDCFRYEECRRLAKT